MDLCLECHDRELQTPTGKIMNMKAWLEANEVRHGPIRQGDCAACHDSHGSDLHVRHVNQAEKGRTCRACHEIHASQKPKHIREAVPFGAWEVPIQYEPTATGGRCAPGCHPPRAYDRASAVANHR